MKKVFFILFLSFLLIKVGAQEVIMQDGVAVNKCDFNYLDPGGLNDYPPNLDYTQTVCSDNNDPFSFFFDEFVLGDGDTLYIYNGTAVDPRNLLLRLTRNNQPNMYPYNYQSARECLTFRFVSGPNNPGNSGWSIFMGCPVCNSTSIIARFDADPNPVYLDNGQAPVSFTDLTINSVKWNWHFGDPAGSTSIVASPNHIYTTAGNYRVKLVVENADGCRDSTYKTITVEAPFFLYVPNAFTPNGDGVNDEFGVKCSGVDPDRFEMAVYSRNGQIVFRTTTPGATWDGKDRNGKVCPFGEYIYIVNAYTSDGIKKEYVGGVTLIR